MQSVRVNLRKSRDDSYLIEIGAGLFGRIPDRLRKMNEIAAWAIISDRNVARLYGQKLLKAMRKAGSRAYLVSFPAGERSKNRKIVARIEDDLFDIGMGRDGAILALGGGVTGDLAGFVAATYMRGVPFVQVPTTLLAMVDSSVGGKTGIDVPAGKNLIGAFHQPKAVFIDPEILKTLPKKELASGMAEVVKHAVIADASLFNFLEKNAEFLLNLDPKALEKVIAKNCAIKARVVERDERESGLRQILNYGHTVGHAIELLSRYRIAHGRAIAIGLAVEGRFSRVLGLIPQENLDRQDKLLARLGLNTRLPGNFNSKEIALAMKLDKKVRHGAVRMALPARIGKMARGEDGSWAISASPELIIPVLRRAARSG